MRKLTNEEFVLRANKNYPNLKILSNYKNNTIEDLYDTGDFDAADNNDAAYIENFTVNTTKSPGKHPMTWAQIKEVTEKSRGANYWSVGDTKQITINGKLSDGLTLSNYNTWVYIIGFDHNSEKEGTGIAFQGFKTAQANGTDICLCDSGYASGKSIRRIILSFSETAVFGTKM